MTDACRITTASSSAPEFNDETGRYERGAPVEVYTGKCRLVPLSVGESVRSREVGERQLVMKTYTLYLPRDAEGFKEGDDVEITGSSDPLLQDVHLYVKDFLFETHQPTRRLIVEYRHEDNQEAEGS